MLQKVSSVNVDAPAVGLLANSFAIAELNICLNLFAGVNAVPHFLQNFAFAGLSARHSGLGHCISITLIYFLLNLYMLLENLCNK
jgi:hypothetical protein